MFNIVQFYNIFTFITQNVFVLFFKFKIKIINHTPQSQQKLPPPKNVPLKSYHSKM